MKAILLIPVILCTFSFSAIGQSKSDFCKRWNLQGYIYWGVTLPPEPNEKGDYIEFDENGTFKSVDEGKSETGTWKWIAGSKSLQLTDSKSKGSLILKVVALTKTKLVVLLKDEEDGIEIKFRSSG